MKERRPCPDRSVQKEEELNESDALSRLETNNCCLSAGSGSVGLLKHCVCAVLMLPFLHIECRPGLSSTQRRNHQHIS